MPIRLPFRRREKVFGPARGQPLDRNAKARIMAYARAWNVRNRQPRQHRGPLTRAYMDVLEALLWGFHNSRSGLCFPSYEAIAKKAECKRSTVAEAIKALEDAGILSWVNRIVRQAVRERDLFGKWVMRWRIVRSSNSYVFRDPLSESENRAGTLNQDISITKRQSQPEGQSNSLLSSPPQVQIVVLDPREKLDAALIRLGRSVGSLPEPSAG